ncbi:MAG: LysR family transcriptional regulator [Chiayiivirga sp.]|jgi:DNA-binding transcriptional LysR family regulator|uniref:LysR family transcriptional regulator n=1 Tax=Chiayiivirga sp. TaxID=2041042 RepID=UPI0025C6D570|nr:LysR family transcriptional regulator [Chiayiivirga sp.]MCI1729172.1 LysR family transcriptional regulator [Chiayiivirga sp.]
MDLRRLSHFIALAEEGRFAPAANRVHLSQAAFSRSIQALEEQAGMTLVDRGPHGITLTQAGEVVLRRARELVFDSSCLMRDLALMKAGDAGELVIGAGPVPAATIVPALLVELRQQCPQVVNRLRFGKLPQLLTQLDAQEIDVCLGDPRQMLRNERYAMIPVGKQFGGMYCRAGHRLLRKGEVNAESLSHYGIALISTSAALMDSLASDYDFRAELAPLETPLRAFVERSLLRLQYTSCTAEQARLRHALHSRVFRQTSPGDQHRPRCPRVAAGACRHHRRQQSRHLDQPQRAFR